MEWIGLPSSLWPQRAPTFDPYHGVDGHSWIKGRHGPLPPNVFVTTTLFGSRRRRCPPPTWGRMRCRLKTPVGQDRFWSRQNSLGLERSERTNSACGSGRHRILEVSWRPPPLQTNTLLNSRLRTDLAKVNHSNELWDLDAKFS